MMNISTTKFNAWVRERFVRGFPRVFPAAGGGAPVHRGALGAANWPPPPRPTAPAAAARHSQSLRSLRLEVLWDPRTHRPHTPIRLQAAKTFTWTLSLYFIQCCLCFCDSWGATGDQDGQSWADPNEWKWNGRGKFFFFLITNRN